MATGSAAIRIDQVFHGYDRGHRELASSISLDAESRETMLVNSDLLAELSGPDSSYLTCYTLPAASRHVLARTWSAGAGFRPGSVWTHSLILDFQALALLQDLVVLDTFLIRSGELERGRAPKPIFVEAGPAAGTNFKPASNAAIAIEGLYGTLAPSVEVPARSEAENDLLALALWRQMWPSLRREFSFVTGASAQRSATGCEWMLRFSDHSADPVALSAGLQALLDDLPASGLTPLRRFLSRYAVEANNPRQIGAPLAALCATPTTGFEKRLRAVRAITEGTPLPRLSRDLVSAELEHANQPGALLAVVKEFGDQSLDIDPMTVVEIAVAMDAVSRGSLLDRAAAIPRDRLGGRVFEAVVRGCDPSILADASQASTLAAMVRLRPDLLTHIRFWPDDDDDRARLVSEYEGDTDLSLAWALLGDEIGPGTTEALLRRSWYPSTDQLLKLLTDARMKVARLLANHALSQPGLSEFVLKNAKLEALEHVADAQIISGRLPEMPASWCMAACRFDGLSLSPSLLVIGYVASLVIGGENGLVAARHLYDPLQRVARQYRLSRDQDRYLQAAITGRVRGWGLVDRLTRSALATWAVSKAQAGALTLSGEHQHSHDLVDAALEQLGRAGLSDALLDPALPPVARTHIVSKLKVQPRKSWWF